MPDLRDQPDGVAWRVGLSARGPDEIAGLFSEMLAECYISDWTPARHAAAMEPWPASRR